MEIECESCTRLRAELAEEKRKVEEQRKKLPVDPVKRRNVLSGISMEDDSRADCLAIVLCTYFSKHEDRPENDPEHDDNFHWGDWVIEKANKALDLIAAALTTPSEGGEL